ncbi:MAG: type II toxin-antitoxin system VapC family toxin [Magnetospirillum sp.]|nr:type II toxin-antitoxin system VapC family toxin [Magnetospirillum sp.]
MRLLLDSHVFLWWQADDPRLSTGIRRSIVGSQVWISAATVWEIAIKVAAGRLDVPEPPVPAILRNGFTPLDVTFAHAERAAALPPYHGDPFDRMLIAQAQAEDLVLVSGDARMTDYPVALLRT